MMKNPIHHYTPQDLKRAYQLVQQDLLNRFLTAEDEATIRFGNLGKFKKSESLVCSKKYGNHVYYRLSFSCFGKLKQAFHNQLSQKYQLK